MTENDEPLERDENAWIKRAAWAYVKASQISGLEKLAEERSAARAHDRDYVDALMAAVHETFRLWPHIATGAERLRVQYDKAVNNLTVDYEEEYGSYRIRLPLGRMSAQDQALRLAGMRRVWELIGSPLAPPEAEAMVMARPSKGNALVEAARHLWGGEAHGAWSTERR